MKAVFTRFFSVLKANTPPSEKRCSSRKFLSLFLILFLAVGNAWGQNEVTLLNTNFTDWKEGAAAPENKGLSESNTYTLTNGIADVADFVGKGCKLNDANNAPTAEGVEGYNANKFRFGSSGNFMKITPRAKFIKGGRVRILVSSEQTKVEKILGTVKIGSTDLGNLHGWTAKNICDWQEFDIPESIDDEIGEIIITRTDNTMFVWGIIILTNSSTPATTYSVTYKAGLGTGDDVIDDNATTVADCPAGFTAPNGMVFAGWKDEADTDVAVGATVSANITLTAQWQAETTKYDVTYNLNGGTGTAPTQPSVAENGTFTVASAEGITPPAGQEFAGWSDGTNTYNAGDTYTMGAAAAVTLTAQWKAAPTVLFHYQWTGSSTQPAVGDVLTGIGGTITVERKEGSEKNLSNESAKFVSSVPSDMKFTTSDSKGVKFGTSDVWFRIALNSGNFEEGDMIAICGYEAFLISSSTAFDGDISSSLSTGSNKENYEVKQCVIPSIGSFPNLYIRRVSSSCGFAAIKVIRPAQKEILSTDITLSAVTVNTEAISAENLATLKADPYKLDLTSEYAEAPTIAFTKQTVITYEDATTKTKTEAIEVVATNVDGKWQARTEINGVTYTVTAIVPATYTVIYKDGETELASEIVKVGEHPTAAGVTTNPHYSLSWKLGDEAVELSNVNGTADQEITLVAVLTAKYASSFDFGAATDLTKDNIAAKLAAVNILVTVGSGGAYDNGATTGYLGYKFKNKGDKLSFLLRQGYRAVITYGFTQSGWTVNDEDAGIVTAQTAYVEKTYTAASADMLYTLVNKSEDSKTSVITKIVIEEIPAISDDATLKDLKVDGTTIEGFNPEKKIYYLTVPYGTDVASMPKITNAVANHGSASVVIYPTDGPEWTNEYGGCYLQQIVVTAEDNTTKGYYHVRTTVDAKEGVTIIKATHTGATTADVIGAIGGTCDKKTQADGKLGSNGHYFGIKLAEGTFKSGDVIKVVASALNGGNTITLFADNEGTTEIGSVAYDQSTKTAYFTLTADVENVYIYRVSSACNSNVEYIEVQRFMDPFIETFEVAGTLGVVNQSTKTITIEVPASTDVTSLTPTITAWANGGATVTPVGAQDFTSPVTYSVFSAYAEDGTTEYTVTVTKAVPSADATLKTLTINGSALALVNGIYEYDYELPYGTTTAPVVVAEANDANATAVVTSVSLTKAVITVTAENGATQEYVINFTVSRAISYVIYDGSVQKNIKESGTGLINWGLVQASSTDSIKITTTCNGKSYTYCVNVFASATASDKRYMTIIIPDGYMAKFYLAGATNSKSNERSLFISKQITGTLDKSIVYSTSSTYEGAAMTSDYQMPGTYYLCSNASIRLYELSVLLYPIDYARDVNAGRYGTICLPNKGQMIGAAVYEIAYMDYKDGAPYKIYFDEILNGKMEAGVPYVFLPNEGYNQLIVTYTAIFNAAATDANGLYGFIGTSATDEFPIPGGVGNYIIQNNQYREVLAGADARIVSNRAYITLAEVPGYNDPLYVAPAPAPGRKRIAMGTTGAQVATGVDQVQGDAVPTKMIINGQLFILRGEKMYDAQGKLVR